MEDGNEIIIESERTIERKVLDGKLKSGTVLCGTFPPRKRGRPCTTNAARERSRVKTLRTAFLELQQTLPAVPPDTKLSKLDVLVLATTYISHLMRTLNDKSMDGIPFTAQGFMHPVKKWPLRTRLYAEILSSTSPDEKTMPLSHQPLTCDYPFDVSTWRR